MQIHAGIHQKFQDYLNDPVDKFRVYLRRKRAEQIRELLANPDTITLEVFEREVWDFETDTLLDGQSIKRFFNRVIGEEELEQLSSALDEGRLTLSGNYIWGSGTALYAPLIKDNDVRLDNLKTALKILNDQALTAAEKALGLLDIHGIGTNTASGLTMIFHPTEYAIFNKPIKDAVRKLGYQGNDMAKFQTFMHELKDELGAEDFIQLDWFFTRNVFGPSNANYWIFQANPNVYDIKSALDNGHVKTWSVSAHKSEIKPGDKVIIWVTGPQAGCYALATIDSSVEKMSNHDEEMEYFIGSAENSQQDRCKVRIDKVLTSDPVYQEDIQVNPVLKALKVGHQGTNFSATKEQYDELQRLVETKKPSYSLEELQDGTGTELETLHRWVKAIRRKGQAIFYGPPGTGKTFVAEKLAKYLVGQSSEGFYELVQFHPAYAYEDFMQGIRPETTGNGSLKYSMVQGRFIEFCNQARTKSGSCVLIIDEINRANLSRVFGELMYLLEYRDREIPLAGGGTFSIPPNVYIIGTMNTADRSIALVDHALRRRFAFIELYPNYEILRKFHNESDFPVEALIRTLQEINQEIQDRNFQVGISYFLQNNIQDKLEEIWRMEIEPYLEEYFFDQPQKVGRFRWERIKDELA